MIIKIKFNVSLDKYSLENGHVFNFIGDNIDKIKMIEELDNIYLSAKSLHDKSFILEIHKLGFILRQYYENGKKTKETYKETKGVCQEWID